MTFKVSFSTSLWHAVSQSFVCLYFPMTLLRLHLSWFSNQPPLVFATSRTACHMR
jgi:hypothetical protein